VEVGERDGRQGLVLVEVRELPEVLGVLSPGRRRSAREPQLRELLVGSCQGNGPNGRLVVRLESFCNRLFVASYGISNKRWLVKR